MEIVPACPLEVNPLPLAGASAIPCTPAVSGISPTTFSESTSRTITFVPREMKSRRVGESNSDVVPESFAAKLDFLQEMIAGWTRRLRARTPPRTQA